MTMQDLLWNFLNSNFGLMVVGFMLTTIAGAFLAARLDRVSWQRQTRIDLYKKRYEEGIQFLDELSRLIGQRHFQLKRWFWAMKDTSEKLEEIEQEYFAVVGNWNATYWMHRNKIRLLVGERYANLFLDDKGEQSRSVHYSFVRAHRAVEQVKSGELGELAALDAQEKIDALSHICSGFQERVTYEFRKQAASLELLDMAKPNNEA